MSIHAVFDRIYQESVWGHKSGPGSDPKNAGPWIEVVNQYLSMESVHTIVDVGCGDGRLMRHYTLEGKRYLGIDASQEVIAQNVGSDSIKFIVGDATTMDIPEADLIIVKDVLQHLPLTYIQAIVPKLMEKAQILLVCNDVQPYNKDIEVGGYRGLDLLAKPFEFNLKHLFDFNSNPHIKRVYVYGDTDVQ